MSEPHDDTAMRVQILRNAFAPTACYLIGGETHMIRHSRWRRFRRWIVARIWGEWTVVDGGCGGSYAYLPDTDEPRAWHPSHREIL